VSLVFTICYILIFHVFQIDLNFFTFPGSMLLVFYRIFKGEAVQIFGFLNMYNYIKLRIKHSPGIVACFLFCGYHLWRTGLFERADAIIIYLVAVIITYFISFQEGTPAKKLNLSVR